jgi:hypothetical protein
MGDNWILHIERAPEYRVVSLTQRSPYGEHNPSHVSFDPAVFFTQMISNTTGRAAGNNASTGNGNEKIKRFVNNAVTNVRAMLMP